MPEGEEIIVGRPDINSFAAFPPDGVALLKQMQLGLSPEAAGQWYQDHYHEAIDIDDFLLTLHEMQFIQEAAADRASSGKPTRFACINWQFIGKCAFSPVAWVIYALICGYCLYAMLSSPYLLPTYNHVFFSPSYTVIELGLFLGQLPCIFFHELFHVLAGMRLGLSSRLSIGRRLYFIVFETDLTALWSVPKKARYLPFLAGMLGDILLFALLTIVASFSYAPANPYTLPGAFCLALAYSTLLRFTWQFYFYLQTDLYYVVTAATGCVNLQQTTRQYLSNRVYRFLGKNDHLVDETAWHARDRQVAPWYVPLFVAGHVFSLGIFAFVGIPVAFLYISGVVTHLVNGTVFSADFWDASVFLTLNIIQFTLIGIFLWREHRQRRRASQGQKSYTNAHTL